MTNRSYKTEALQVDQRDEMADFDRLEITLNGVTKRVYKTGTGPAVVIMAEMPGISVHVLRFCRWVRDAGFTVWLPALFGTEGGPIKPLGAVTTMIGGCISREFNAFAANKSSPVTQWLRALAAHAYEECGGQGVGALGMCFTGNFALSMMLEPSVKAPVLCQPSLPLFKPAAIDISEEELAIVNKRLEEEDLTVLGYRFEGDGFCKAARFETLERALGDRFKGTTFPDSAALPDAPMKPHSVVTLHLIDDEGEPTRGAVDEILAFFKHRLTAA